MVIMSGGYRRAGYRLGGSMSSLRSRVARLGRTCPEVRPFLHPDTVRTARSLNGAEIALVRFIKSNAPTKAFLLKVVGQGLGAVVESLADKGAPLTAERAIEELRKSPGDYINLQGLDGADRRSYLEYLDEWFEDLCRGPNGAVPVSISHLRPDDLDTDLSFDFRLFGEDFGDNPEGVEVPERTYEREIRSAVSRSGGDLTRESSGITHDRTFDSIGMVYRGSCSWPVDVAVLVRGAMTDTEMVELATSAVAKALGR